MPDTTFAAPVRAPLAELRVLDFTQVLSGPFATMMLADLGADVVKVERPEGDELRSIGRYKGRDDHEDYFNANNRSKRSIVLDLKETGDQQIAQDLAAAADVVVENLTPGTAARLGIGWDMLHARNPRLVYCSITGFGQTGPYRDRLALDPVIQAIAGVMSVTGEPDGEPMQIGAPLADIIAGSYAAYAILGALHGARRDGIGRYIDISMQDAMLYALGPRMGETLQAGLNPPRVGNANPMRVPADTYRTRDGRWLSVICLNDRHWPPLCRAVGLERLLEDRGLDRNMDRLRRRDELSAIFMATFAERNAAEWAERLEAGRVPYALVKDYKDALTDPQVEHRGTVRRLQHPTAGDIGVVGPPWIIDGAGTEMLPPPLLGQHGAAVLSDWLGWDAERVARYVAAHPASTT